MTLLIVCLGNICRSSMAEGIMKSLIKQHNLDWQVHSAGTESYHIGEPPHQSAQKTCHNNGIDISTQRARRFERNDFDRFDKIYAMAGDVLSELTHLGGTAFDETKTTLFLDELYPGQKRSVPDPWYGTEADFKTVFEMIKATCVAIIAKYKS